MRSGWPLAGLLLVVAAGTAVPAIIRAGHVPGPKWLAPAVVAVCGVVLMIAKPLLTTWTDALSARVRTRTDVQARARAAEGGLPSVGGQRPRVEQVTGRALLDIHEAIPLPAGSDEGLSPELPEYVTRDVDADLRTALKAQSRTGGFNLLVGPAAVGKTRCAYEALRAEVPRWELLMPADGAEVADLAAGGLSHAVVWLNETQNFLTGPRPLTAATVRRLLADTTSPVILIGTIWPGLHRNQRSTSTAWRNGPSAREPRGVRSSRRCAASSRAR